MDYTKGLPCPLFLGGFVKEATSRGHEERVAEDFPQSLLDKFHRLAMFLYYRATFSVTALSILSLPPNCVLLPPLALLGLGVAQPQESAPSFVVFPTACTHPRRQLTVCSVGTNT